MSQPICPLDPIILKGIYLMRSRTKESTSQLKALLDELIQKSKNDGKQLDPNPMDNMEKLKRDLIDLGSLQMNKKAKIEENLNISQASMEDSFLNEIFGDTKDDDDDDKYDSSFVEEQNLCVICLNSDSTIKNQLIECQDCHKYYHQECHIPIVYEDVNDPRFVWYCKNCSRGPEIMDNKQHLVIKKKSSEIAPLPPSNIANLTPKTLNMSMIRKTSIVANIHHSSGPLGKGMTDKNLNNTMMSSNVSPRQTARKISSNLSLTVGTSAKPSILLSSLPRSSNINVNNTSNNTTQNSSINSRNKSWNKETSKPAILGLAGFAANILQMNDGASSTKETPNSPTAAKSYSPGLGNKSSFGFNTYSPLPQQSSKPSSSIASSHYQQPKSSYNIFSSSMKPKSDARLLPSALSSKPNEKRNSIPSFLNVKSQQNKINPINNNNNNNIFQPSHKPIERNNSLPHVGGTSNSKSNANVNSNNPNFAPPTMKDFEKRLQKMKRKKSLL